MAAQSDTIEDRLNDASANFTPAEVRLAQSILDNYPVSGLGSITAIAQNAGVSTPTVARLVQKLGYKGFPEFQERLRQELAAKISTPIEKLDRWVGEASNSHVLNRFADAAFDNIRQTLGQIDTAVFDKSCDLLADTERQVFVVGGRITRALADYFFLHLQVARTRVTHIQSVSNAWPHYVLDIDANDIVVIFDVRRYENSSLQLAEMAAERRAQIILFTDQWRSPVSKFADLVFSSRIVVPSAWDSAVATLLLIEALIAAVHERTRAASKRRMGSLEEMFDRTRIFRKFA